MNCASLTTNDAAEAGAVWPATARVLSTAAEAAIDRTRASFVDPRIRFGTGAPRECDAEGILVADSGIHVG
ncbi:hypothetical protein SLA_1583 [Streptomyces laurentii]|uniref:Uncharacterized protein n=1 Tax=Streptomyces laurentii TaxID=39478 RepID=A0A160NXG9_STRLU|nr:hypothetical protein SLA_1583 [Streptomyces laurentii]